MSRPFDTPAKTITCAPMRESTHRGWPDALRTTSVTTALAQVGPSDIASATNVFPDPIAHGTLARALQLAGAASADEIAPASTMAIAAPNSLLDINVSRFSNAVSRGDSSARRNPSLRQPSHHLHHSLADVVDRKRTDQRFRCVL